MERKLIAGIKEGENPAKKMTVQQLFDEYIIAKQYEIREITADKNKSIYNLHIKPTILAQKRL